VVVKTIGDEIMVVFGNPEAPATPRGKCSSA